MNPEAPNQPYQPTGQSSQTPNTTVPQPPYQPPAQPPQSNPAPGGGQQFFPTNPLAFGPNAVPPGLPEPKRSKKWLFIVGGAVLFLAIIAIATVLMTRSSSDDGSVSLGKIDNVVESLDATYTDQVFADVAPAYVAFADEESSYYAIPEDSTTGRVYELGALKGSTSLEDESEKYCKAMADEYGEAYNQVLDQFIGVGLAAKKANIEDAAWDNCSGGAFLTNEAYVCSINQSLYLAPDEGESDESVEESTESETVQPATPDEFMVHLAFGCVTKEDAEGFEELAQTSLEIQKNVNSDTFEDGFVALPDYIDTDASGEYTIVSVPNEADIPRYYYQRANEGWQQVGDGLFGASCEDIETDENARAAFVDRECYSSDLEDWRTVQ